MFADRISTVVNAGVSSSSFGCREPDQLRPAWAAHLLQ